jgi:hypothetical protein
MKLPLGVSQQEWRTALEQLRVKEKAATRARPDSKRTGTPPSAGPVSSPQ